MRLKLFTSALVMFLIFFSPLMIVAQDNSSAVISIPTTDDYPKIHTFLEVYEKSGKFVSGLVEDDIRLLENGERIEIDEIKEFSPGVQFVIAMNYGHTMAIRDTQGISRLDTINTQLTSWLDMDDGIDGDDLSFVTSTGYEEIHIGDRDEFMGAITALDIDPRDATPNLNVLSRAIAIASDPILPEGARKVVLLITPPPTEENIATIQNLTSLASQSNVKVYIWMISSPFFFDSNGAIQLQELASETSGSLSLFSGVETLPSIVDILEPFRHIYQLSYHSRLITDEPHELSVFVNIEADEVQSNTQQFSIFIGPPNPMFINPPDEIIRAGNGKSSADIEEKSLLFPTFQTIDFLIEFPDKHPRNITRATLFVDGIANSEITNPPFNQFLWDIRGFRSNRTHLLQIEVMDDIGFVGRSLETPVIITIKHSPMSIITTLYNNAPVLIGSAAVLLTGVIVLRLITKGKIKPRPFGRRKNNIVSPRKNGYSAVKTSDRKRVSNEPVDGSRGSRWSNRISWPVRRKKEYPIAELLPVRSINDSAPVEAIQISVNEVTIGRDPTLAIFPISDPSIDDLHARLVYTDDDEFLLYDEGSNSGTWLNYSKILNNKVVIKNGDVIHFGSVGYILRILDTKKIPKVRISPWKPDL